MRIRRYPPSSENRGGVLVLRRQPAASAIGQNGAEPDGWITIIRHRFFGQRLKSYHEADGRSADRLTVGRLADEFHQRFTPNGRYRMPPSGPKDGTRAACLAVPRI